MFSSARHHGGRGGGIRRDHGSKPAASSSGYVLPAALWKIPVPWGDGTIHDVLVAWPPYHLKKGQKEPNKAAQERERMKSLHCIAAYLRDPPADDTLLRRYKPTRCIVKSRCGHITGTETVTWSNPNGTAYHNADPFHHQTVRFSSEEHYAERKGFAVHIYTDEAGIYDGDRDSSWPEVLTFMNPIESGVFDQLSSIRPRLYVYDNDNRGRSVQAQGSGTMPSNSAGSSAGAGALQYSSGAASMGSTQFSTNNQTSRMASTTVSSGNTVYGPSNTGSTGSTAGVYPDNWYTDPWDQTGRTMRWFANGAWTTYTR